MKLRRGLYGVLLVLQAGLVITGGAVRLTGSGLGCPTWPECTPGSYKPVPNQAEGQLHAWIEFGNRLLTFALVAVALAVLAYVLFKKRKDLHLLALGQAIVWLLPNMHQIMCRYEIAVEDLDRKASHSKQANNLIAAWWIWRPTTLRAIGIGFLFFALIIAMATNKPSTFLYYQF